MSIPSPVAPSPADTPSPLTPLQELPLPAAVSYTPQTVGWVGVAIVLLAIMLLGTWAAWRRYRARRYRRAALRELAEIEGRLADTEQRYAALTAIPRLLKRTSLAAAPRERVAALSGDEWLAFLRRTQGQFDEHTGPLLALASYAPPDQVLAISQRDAATLVTQARDWIRHHHVEV